jgi:hypothetical protein
MLKIQKATKKRSKLRMALCGPSGSGKTYTALRFAFALASDDKRICVIDTERGSASKYVGEAPDGIPWKFDVIEPATFSPTVYTEAIIMAYEAGYDVLIIDSLSHAWSGKGGALEMKDNIGQSWTAWRKVTPVHDKMVDTILRCPMHVIVTMRSKMEHVQEEDGRGKTVVRKVGMAPIQRAGMEYEFDVVMDMDWSHIGTVSKTRCSAITDATQHFPDARFMKPVIDWLDDGVIVDEVDEAPAPPTKDEKQKPAPPKQQQPKRKPNNTKSKQSDVPRDEDGDPVQKSNGGDWWLRRGDVIKQLKDDMKLSGTEAIGLLADNASAGGITDAMTDDQIFGIASGKDFHGKEGDGVIDPDAGTPPMEWPAYKDWALANDDWQPDLTHEAACRQLDLDFGKHSGKTLAEIAREDKSYLRFLATEYKGRRDEIKQAAVYLRACRYWREANGLGSAAEEETRQAGMLFGEPENTDYL